jgi:hypothetical protein
MQVHAAAGVPAASHFIFAELEFEGKPGQNFIARPRYIALNRLQIWLEDTATGEKISQGCDIRKLLVCRVSAACRIKTKLSKELNCHDLTG